MLELASRRARGAGGHEKDGPKPGPQGLSRLVEDAVFASARKSLDSGTSDAYEGMGLLAREGGAASAWARLRARGWGAATEGRMGAEGWRVTVINPIDNALIAGWLRALYTVAVGREMRVEVIDEPAQTTFEID